jgi:drug/metabolite transporter (DMT)-like permease
LYKSGTDRAVAAGGNLVYYVANARIVMGVVCYVLVMVCFVAAFRRGGSPTVLYPIYATTFIWAAMIGLAIYQVPIKAAHVLGMALIILGVSMMGR